MARINNQAVMQKLIDDLKLYPGADIIPTELAEKILPVFNVNEQDVNVEIKEGITMKTASIVRSGSASNTSVTVYAVPATGDFYLTGLIVEAYSNNPGVAIAGNATLTVTVAGSAQSLAYVGLNTPIGGGSEMCSLGLQNPLLIDKSTNITLVSNAVNLSAKCSIIGYYVSP